MVARVRPELLDVVEPMIISETADDVVVAIEISRAMLVGYGRLYEVLMIDVTEIRRYVRRGIRGCLCRAAPVGLGRRLGDQAVGGARLNDVKGVRRAGAFLIWCVALPLHQT